MKQFIVLVSTICLGIMIAGLVMGFKAKASTINNTAVTALDTVATTITATE